MLINAMFNKIHMQLSYEEFLERVEGNNKLIQNILNNVQNQGESDRKILISFIKNNYKEDDINEIIKSKSSHDWQLSLESFSLTELIDILKQIRLR